MQAYILHRYPWRETSAILKCFTAESGLVSGIAKGVQKPKSPWRGIAQPLQLLHIDFTGKNELKTIRSIEPNGPALIWPSRALTCGLYINELTLRLLKPEQSSAALFESYQYVLNALSQTEHPAPWLREYELVLFKHLGWLPDLNQDEQGASLNPNQYYRLTQEHPLQAVPDSQAALPHTFLGSELNAIWEFNWQSPTTLKAAKRLTHLIMGFYNQNQPFNSRQLWV